MPSYKFGYIPGSGFVPLISGNPWSGVRLPPQGYVYIVADVSNSGSLYISLSGGNPLSGVTSTLVGSGGPTVQSGDFFQSGGAMMDGVQLRPGQTYTVPRGAVLNTGPNSGAYSLCAACELAGSGRDRVYFEFI